MSLAEYKKKRDFDKSPEPEGAKGGESDLPVFVVQKHRARSLHYDFRLEAEGALKSWAIPKGPSNDPRNRHLAVRVEDHPLDYADFEGNIPEGEYGAGTVMVWDKGTYHLPKAKNKRENESGMKKGLNRGRLAVVLNGKKLKGEYGLIRMKGQEGKNWLLIKKKDEFANQDIQNPDKSVLSGKKLEELKGE